MLPARRRQPVIESDLPKDVRIEKTAVDCPFGTTNGFFMLLRGGVTDDAYLDGFKTRTTEQWLRQHLWDYETNGWWMKLSGIRKPQLYVNKTAHVKPTLGLQIVP